MNTKIAEKVAKILLDIHAVTLRPKKPFRYASGILSPVYTDCRLLMSYPKQRKIIRDFYVKTIGEKGKFDVIAGTATAGIPHASWVSEKMNLPMIYVRGKAKDHGKGNQIEGKLNKGQEVVVVEDLISTGESSAETVRAVRKSGGKAQLVFAIMTYSMQKSKDNFKSNKITLVPMTDFPTVVKIAQKEGYIKKSDENIILEWIKDPAGWGKKMGFQ